MSKYLGLLLLMILGGACQSEQATSSANTSNETALNDALSKVINAQQTTSPSFESIFNKEEQAALLTIKKDFDFAICKGREASEINKCYEFHAWKLRSDFIQKNPITLNFPYNDTYRLDPILLKEQLSGIWTNKCGFQKEDETILHYFCLDASAKIMDYLKILSKDNEVIRLTTEMYADKKAFIPGDIENVIMSSVESFDFTKMDHQIFHLLFHLTIGEEQRASREVAGSL